MLDIAAMFEPKASPEYVLMTTHIINKAKTLAPDRVPQPTRDTIMEWAEALSASFRRFHPTTWPMAVTIWAAELADHRMATPRDIIKAAQIADKRRLETPEGRAMLEQRRQDRADWLAGER